MHGGGVRGGVCPRSGPGAGPKGCGVAGRVDGVPCGVAVPGVDGVDGGIGMRGAGGMFGPKP